MKTHSQELQQDRLQISELSHNAFILLKMDTHFIENGGEEEIRTLESLLSPTPLAGERLRPLGHLSKERHKWYR